MHFSIVTPVLNGAQFLEATIASVLAQTHRDFEYRIIDGGSTDGSLAIARAAAARDGRVTVTSREGLGLYASIALGFAESQGEMIAWINADDLYTPWAFEAVADYRRRRPDADWISGLPGLWSAGGVLRYVRPEGERPRALLRAGWFHKDLLGFVQQESVMFARSLFESLSADERRQFEGLALAGDYYLWKCLAARTALRCVPTVLGGFRRHGDNRSVTRIDAYMDEVRALGAVDLPWPFRPLARRLYWAWSANRAYLHSLGEDAAY